MANLVARRDVFHAISDATRRSILDLLSERERTVGELVESFRVSQSAVSQHLRILRESGLVRPQRVGRNQIYSMDPAPLMEIHDWLGHYHRFWTRKLRALGRYLDDEP